MDLESSKPTIVLVHGAVEDSSLWTHGVIQGLQRDGYPVKVFSNPLRGVAHDAAYLRSLLDTITGPVILVATMSGTPLVATTGIASGVLLLGTAAAGFHDLAGVQSRAKQAAGSKVGSATEGARP